MRSMRPFSTCVPFLAPLACVALLAGCGSNQSSSSTASPTATAGSPPTAVVVTATSGPATAAPVTVVITATPPPPSPGRSTPLPGATPVPTAPGLTLGMITRPSSVVAADQAGADRKDPRFTFYLHPDQVIQHNLPSYGFSKPVDLVAPSRPSVSYSGRPVRKAVVKQAGQLYRVYVAQPGRTGPTGIWVVVTILRQQLQTGEISRPASVVNRIQQLANQGRPAGLIYLDPNKVITQELPQYGFDPDGYKVVTNPHPVHSTTGRPLQMATVAYGGARYDVYMAQPGVQGKKGVWVIVTIRPV